MAHETAGHRPWIFCDLATFACLDPPLDVAGHPWPITALPHQLRCALDALVSMVLVQLGQSLLLKGGRKDKLEILLPPIRTEDPAVQHPLLFDQTVPLSQEGQSRSRKSLPLVISGLSPPPPKGQEMIPQKRIRLLQGTEVRWRMASKDGHQ